MKKYSLCSLKNLLVIATLLFSSLSRAEWNRTFGYTHMLPSPYTIPAGRLVFGTYVGLGVTDFLDVGTNVLMDLYQVYNAQAKASIVRTEVFAAALTFGFQTYNYKDLDSANPDLQITSYQPGGVLAFALAEELAWFVGGNIQFSKVSLVENGITKSGYAQGSRGETDLAFAYSKTSALSAGVSYDFSYDLIGFGLSHHWSGFQLGLHVIPNANKEKFIPIISGGGAIDL